MCSIRDSGFLYVLASHGAGASDLEVANGTSKNMSLRAGQTAQMIVAACSNSMKPSLARCTASSSEVYLISTGGAKIP